MSRGDSPRGGDLPRNPAGNPSGDAKHRRLGVPDAGSGKARDSASPATHASRTATNHDQQMICIGDAEHDSSDALRRGSFVCVTVSIG
jgi:hypothetical protein